MRGGAAELAGLLHVKSAPLGPFRWPQLPCLAGLTSVVQQVMDSRAFLGCLQSPWPLLLQDTLNAVFGNVKGEECIFLWRFIGGILATLLPALAYGCRVSARTF